MKKNLITRAILITALTFTPLLASQALTIKVCTFPQAPFVMVDKKKKQLIGADIDLIVNLCNAIGAKCDFILAPQTTAVVAYLNSDKCDAWLGGYIITSARVQQMDFTQPYYPAQANYLVPQNSNFGSLTNGFKDKTIAVVSGSSFKQYLTTTYGNNIKIAAYPTIAASLAAVKAFQVNAVLADSLALEYWQRKKGNSGFKQFPLFSSINKELAQGEGYGIAVKKGNTALLTTLNHALAKINATTLYRQLVAQYLAHVNKNSSKQ